MTYHRLRLTQDQPAAHAELAEILPVIEQSESLSTINSFRELAVKNALTSEQFMKVAALRPVTYDDGDNGGTLFFSNNPLMAGARVNTLDSHHVDVYAARVLNEHIPVATLAELVHQNYFPTQLQFEFAVAVWSRAVLLDKPEIAATLTPTLIAGEPRWKPYLEAYDAAQTDDDRKVTGLLAMLRFPGVRPYINAGATREEGLARYSGYRDNWWCANMAAPSYSTSSNFNAGWPTSEPIPPLTPLPAFVTAEMSAEQRQEQAILNKLGDAPAYFGREALAWVKAHPHDPHNAQLLDFTARAMRNGCNLEQTYTLHKKIDALRHKH